MLEYKQSQIYKIYSKDTNIKDIYIGSTYNFKCRYYTHKNNCININNKKYNYRVYKFIRDNGGWDNFKMEVMYSINVLSKLELRQIERTTIKLFEPSLNVQIPLRTRAEYYQDNATKIRNTTNQYRIDNKEKLYKRTDCICGGKYMYDTRHQHFKTKKHIDYMISHAENLKHMADIVKSA